MNPFASVPRSAVVSSVADSASSVTLLASNPKRKGYKLFNDSSAIAYVKDGATATTTDFSYQIAAGGFYQFAGPGTYTGRIDCIWASNSTGSMRITEIS